MKTHQMSFFTVLDDSGEWHGPLPGDIYHFLSFVRVFVYKIISIRDIVLFQPGFLLFAKIARMRTVHDDFGELVEGFVHKGSVPETISKSTVFVMPNVSAVLDTGSICLTAQAAHPAEFVWIPHQVRDDMRWLDMSVKS